MMVGLADIYIWTHSLKICQSYALCLILGTFGENGTNSYTIRFWPLKIKRQKNVIMKGVTKNIFHRFPQDLSFMLKMHITSDS